MSFKSFVWVGVFFGSIIGGYIPVLFGLDLLSMWGVIGSAIGGLLGIWAAYKIAGQ